MIEVLDHLQAPIQVKTDNSTAVTFSTNNLKEKHSKSWDIRLHWLRDRAQQQQFRITWEKGALNKADYLIKHFPPPYHQHVRSQYILKGY